MTAAAVLKLVTGGRRDWSSVRFSNYPDWRWVHEELGPDAREYVSPDGDWVVFVDGSLLYYVTDTGARLCFRLEGGW